MKTWHLENAVVAAVLAAVALCTGGSWREWIGAAAVFCGFCHASIAERMREREAARPVPSVECHRLSTWFFLAKEAFWVVYFVALGAWSALVGCGLFLLYPLWRRWWRSVHPMAATPTATTPATGPGEASGTATSSPETATATTTASPR